MADEQRDEQQAPEMGEEQLEGFTFSADYQSKFSTVYANFALVSHTGDDLAVDFCLIAPPYHVHTETKTVPLPVIARVMVAPGFARGLIEALRTQLEKQTSERQTKQIIIPVQNPGDNTDA